MDAKELAKQICLSSKTMEELYDLVVKNLHQTRNEALEEAAKVANECEGHYSPECECMNIAKAIRALKEKI